MLTIIDFLLFLPSSVLLSVSHVFNKTIRCEINFKFKIHRVSRLLMITLEIAHNILK